MVLPDQPTIEQARAWVADCQWTEAENDADFVDDLDDSAIVAGINRHYDGGWSQFLADAEVVL